MGLISVDMSAESADMDRYIAHYRADRELVGFDLADNRSPNLLEMPEVLNGNRCDRRLICGLADDIIACRPFGPLARAALRSPSGLSCARLLAAPHFPRGRITGGDLSCAADRPGPEGASCGPMGGIAP